MKSPFPGMDPYIEACGLWEDFHDDLIGEIKRALATALPDRYLVRTGDRSYIVLIESEGKERESFVEIYETDPDQRLVTCMEVLSPSNKRRGSEGWEVYLRKRQALLLGAANFVEIDLVRSGHKMPMLDPWPKAPYTLLVCRQSRAPYCTVLPAHFQRPLPLLPVPLASPDPDISLTLQPMIDAIYARGRYYRSIDYSSPLSPPLKAEEQSWLAEQLGAGQKSG